MKNLIDKYFKNKLDVPQEPPEGAWEFIQNHLPQKAKKRYLPLWLQLSGIAALFLVTAGGIYTVNLSNQQSKNQLNPVPNSSVGAVANSTAQEILELDNFDNESQQTNMSESESLYEADRRFLTNKNANNYDSKNYNSINYKTKLNEENSTFQSLINPENFITQNSKLNLTSEKNNWEKPEKDEPLAGTETHFSNPLLAELEKQNQELLAASTKTLKEKKSKNDFKKKIDFDRFYISGFVSPMALNSFVGNSMLADEMGQYQTENNVTLSYGVKGAYAVSPRVKIRTGLTVTGFEQITKNVPLTVSTPSSSYTRSANTNNINYNGRLRIENASMAAMNESELVNATMEGNIQQLSQYIEIPVEAEVSIVKTNSIGISATGGGSTWLLSKNKIYAHTGEYIEELGKADNLNKTTFSANAGLKFDMQITDNVQINLEPNFKYLFNPVDNIEKFNPYTVGVNAGVSVSLE